jgi:toxin secretion/phage lysis holin
LKTEWNILLGGLVGIFSQIFGGFDNLFAGLLVIMTVDYVTGIIAALLGKSGKTENGYLSSKAGFKGILKKLTMLLSVCMAKYVGEMFDMKGLRDMIITFFAVNDCISILENGGRIGVKYPEKLKNILEDLLEREE